MSSTVTRVSSSAPAASVRALNAVESAEPSVRRIVRAAGQAFGRLGFEGASMNAIAQEAGVSKSLVLYHFESKEQLFVEVQLQVFSDVLDRVRGLGAPADGTGFLRAMDEVMRFVETDIKDLRVLVHLHSAAAQGTGSLRALEAFNEEVDRLVIRGLDSVLGPAVAALTLPVERVVRLLRTLFNGLILELATATTEEARTKVRETFGDAKTLLTLAMFRPFAATDPKGDPHVRT